MTDDDEYDDSEPNSSAQKQNQKSNNAADAFVNPVYFATKRYTETVGAGAKANLKCDAQNLNGNYIHVKCDN